MDAKIRQAGIEYCLTEHCNLNCYGCDHATALFSPKFTELEVFEKDLRILSEVLSAEELRIVGGEPLLHPQLVEFLQISREVAIADKIVLYTNGLLLHKAPREMWELIDELWVSIYPNVSRKFSLEALSVISNEYGVKLRPYEINEFKLTLLNTRIDDSDLVTEIFQDCDLAHQWSCHAIYEGRYYKCAQSPLFEDRLRRLGIVIKNKDLDAIKLHNNPSLKTELEQYLKSEKPLLACTYCLGTSGPSFPHFIVGAKGRREWLEEDHQWAIEQTREKLSNWRKAQEEE